MSMALPTHAGQVKTPRDLGSFLAINGGSSSIRFALYCGVEPLRRLLVGKIDRVGLSGTTLTSTNESGQTQISPATGSADRRVAVGLLLEWLATQTAFASVKAVGHRSCHAGITR